MKKRSSTTTPTRILIVEDHPIVRQGYLQLIENQTEMEVCGFAASQNEALEQIIKARPEVAIVDLTLADSNGIELIKQIKSRNANVKILVISAHDESLFAERALHAGALGYLNKQEATDKLIEGIRQVVRGDVYLSEQMTKRLLKQTVGGKWDPTVSPIDTLTDRELEVFEHVGHGLATRQIARILHLSPKTIERYRENIKRKLNLSHATELIQRATQWVLEGR